MKPVFFFIVPGGQEAKFSGVYTFCQAILNFIPLLCFFAAYEATGSLTWGFLIMAAFFGAGGCFFASVDMDKARAAVVDSGTLEIRSANVNATTTTTTAAVAIESGEKSRRAPPPRTASADADPRRSNKATSAAPGRSF